MHYSRFGTANLPKGVATTKNEKVLGVDTQTGRLAEAGPPKGVSTQNGGLALLMQARVWQYLKKGKLTQITDNGKFGTWHKESRQWCDNNL